VAEGARLESVFTRKGNVGSNPTLSATLFAIVYEAAVFTKPNSYFRLIKSSPIRRSLRLITRRRGGCILNFGQAPDGESNDLNHSESEFVAQRVNETEVGLREPNGSGLEFVIRHRCYFYNTTNRRVVAEEH
jgi:hypothetical protein